MKFKKALPTLTLAVTLATGVVDGAKAAKALGMHQSVGAFFGMGVAVVSTSSLFEKACKEAENEKKE